MMGSTPPRKASRIGVAKSAWDKFWFLPEPAYTLGLVRIAFGALMVYWTLDLLPVLRVLFTADGPVPVHPSEPWKWGLFQIWGSDTALTVGWIVLLVSSASLLVGWHSRLAAVLVWLLMLSFIRRNLYIFNAGDSVISITGLFLALSACGAALSLDQRRRTGRFWSAEVRLGWPIRLMRVELSLIYLFSALTKLLGDTWNNGSAVSFPLRTFHDWAILPAPRWLAENPYLMNVATWGTLMLELSLAILVWNTRFRYVVLSAGVILHTLIWLNLSVAYFSLAVLVLYLAWLPWERVRDMPGWIRVRAVGRLKRPRRSAQPVEKCASSDSKSTKST